MRKVMFFLAVFGLAASLWAAHPWVGTWKVNVAKSRLPIDDNRQEHTVVIRELGDQLELTGNRIQTDGSTISTKYTWPQQGGFRNYQQGGSPEGMLILETVIDADMYTTTLQNGKQIRVTRWITDKDGITVRAITKDVDTNGKAYDHITVWERQ